MADFAKQLVPFGTAIKQFSEQVSGINETDVTSAALAGKTLFREKEFIVKVRGKKIRLDGTEIKDAAALGKKLAAECKKGDTVQVKEDYADADTYREVLKALKDLKEKYGIDYSGDYVEIDADGYIRILDRVTDIIIVGGFNVYPQEVEAILSEHDAVNTAVVVGMPNDISGEVPKAYVIKTQGAKVSENELVKFCKERLSHYKVPRAIEFVESLPISATGKILRRVLRQKERDKQ